MNQANDKQAVLITGALGGLGSALVDACRSLENAGLVVACDIREEILTRFRQQTDVLAFKLDVSSEASIRILKEQLEKKGIRVKYLVNNAGVNRFFAVSEASEDLLNGILKVNLYGPVLMTSAFLDHLSASRGRVVQISSDSIHLPIPFHPYPASKVAQEAFSVSMRRELKFLGVDLVMIRPGAIRTKFIEEMKTISNPVSSSRYTKWFDKFGRLANKNVGKQSPPEAVARLVLKALTAARPRPYYSINKNAKISFFRLFPESIQDRLIKRTLSR